MISNWVGNQGQAEKGSAERSAQLIKILNTRGKEPENESQGQSRYASNPYQKFSGDNASIQSKQLVT